MHNVYLHCPWFESRWGPFFHVIPLYVCSLKGKMPKKSNFKSLITFKVKLHCCNTKEQQDTATKTMQKQNVWSVQTVNKWHRTQVRDRNSKGEREGPGRERNSQCRGLGAAWRAAFSPAHERCDCPMASQSQESSPSSGRRPLYLPGTQGRGEKPSAGYVRYHAGAGGGGGEGGVKKKKLLFNMCYKYFRETHTHTHIEGTQDTHTHRRTAGP